MQDRQVRCCRLFKHDVSVIVPLSENVFHWAAGARLRKYPKIYSYGEVDVRKIGYGGIKLLLSILENSLTCLVRICIIKDIALDVLMPVLYCRVTALSLYTASNRSNSASALRHITINTRDEWPLLATKQWFVKWGISRLIVSVN